MTLYARPAEPPIPAFTDTYREDDGSITHVYDDGYHIVEWEGRFFAWRQGPDEPGMDGRLIAECEGIDDAEEAIDRDAEQRFLERAEQAEAERKDAA